MKVTPQPTHGRPSYWVAKSVGSQFSVCGPVFAGSAPRTNFTPMRSPKRRRPRRKRRPAPPRLSCADGRPARTCDQNHRRARTRGGGAGDGVSNVTTPTLRTRQQESGKPLGVVCIAASSATCLQRPKTSAACDCKSRMEGNRTTSPTGRRRPPWIHARGARRRPSADASASRRDAIRIERKCNCDEMRPPTRRPQKG